MQDTDEQSPTTVQPPNLDAPAPTPVAPSPETRPEPTRYGDWEVRGRCIDF
jgi:hypothetical protein